MNNSLYAREVETIGENFEAMKRVIEMHKFTESDLRLLRHKQNDIWTVLERRKDKQYRPLNERRHDA